MIARGAIGLRGITLPQWVNLAASAVVFTVAVAGGGAALAGLVKVAAVSAAPAGGGSAVAGLVKAAAVSVAPAGGGAALAGLVKNAAVSVAANGGGAAQLGLVKSTLFTVAAAGGGAIIVGFAALNTSLFDVPLPGSRIIDGGAAGRTITIKPVGSIR